MINTHFITLYWVEGRELCRGKRIEQREIEKKKKKKRNIVKRKLNVGLFG